MNSLESDQVFVKICEFLQGLKWKCVDHKATFTSEESAAARDEDLSIGGKAIVMKIDGVFMLFVISASRRLNSKKIKKYFKAKSLRFASKDELLSITGLTPGAVPPFGRPIFDCDLYVDESIVSNERIAFNAGMLTKSIVMSVADFLQVAKPTVFSFSND